METIHLFDQVGPGGVTGHSNGEIAWLAHLLSALIEAFVEAVDNAHQPNRIHIVDRGAGLVIAQRWRIARQREDVAHAQRFGADQVRLEPHQ